MNVNQPMNLEQVAESFALRDFRNADANGTLDTLRSPAGEGGFYFGGPRTPPNMDAILRALIPGFNALRNAQAFNSGTNTKQYLRNQFRVAYFNRIDLLFRIKREEEIAPLKEAIRARTSAIALQDFSRPSSIPVIREMLRVYNSSPFLKPDVGNPLIYELKAGLDHELGEYLERSYINDLRHLLQQRNNINRRGGKRKTRKH